jgi:carnitine O-acetyltransferase
MLNSCEKKKHLQILVFFLVFFFLFFFMTTFGLQHTLPRLPIPSLEHTCSVYLKSIIPLQTIDEHAKSKAIVNDFLHSELSQSLQQRLIDIDRTSPSNWLEDNFWLRKGKGITSKKGKLNRYLAYLEWREPLMVNSDWYILGKNDDRHPPQLLSNMQPSGRFSKFQVKRAAHMTRRILEYKEMIDR